VIVGDHCVLRHCRVDTFCDGCHELGEEGHDG
jgi:hypothetical protein